MFIRLKTWYLIRKVEWPKCWNLDTPGARFYLTICFAGTVRYSSLTCRLWCGGFVTDPQSVRSGMNEWKNGEVTLRRTTILDINQEDSSKSEDWKVCMNPGSSISMEREEGENTRWWIRKVQTSLGALKSGKLTLWLDSEYQGSTSRRVFCANYSRFPAKSPSRIIGLAPQQIQGL